MTEDISQIPFIDIAVKDAVREAMVAGKAAIILDAELSSILWANGVASSLFGFDGISDLLNSGLSAFATTLRQIKSAAAQKPVHPQAMLLRISSGIQSRLVSAHVQIVQLTSARIDAVLLVIDRDQTDHSEADLARDVISGLEADGAGAALLGEDGVIIASGQLFDGFGIPSTELAALTSEIKDEDDRLVKRLVSRGEDKTMVAIGLGRLSETPVRNIIVAMETDQKAEVKPEPIAAPRGPYARTIDAPPPLVDLGTHDAEDDAFEAELLADAVSDEVDDAAPYSPNLAQGPVRFVWKTDRDGAFIEISDEFGSAVGKNAADVIGRTMGDVVQVFELDPSGDIEASMARHDTWSGKIVLWPIQGTDLRVPVDLAALPYYNREREFEGYRGFGIVRMSDAVIDPEAIGLSLLSGVPEKNTDETLEKFEETDDADVLPFDDPFEGEVPALDTSNVTPLRRGSDLKKIVPFAPSKRDADASGGLDENEVAAFKSIGERLEKDVKATEEVTAPHEADEISDAKVADDWLARLDEAEADNSAATADEEHPSIGADGIDLPPASPGLGPDELEALPLPLLIVRGETALYGNQSFRAMSGYQSVDALNEVGLDRLFGDHENELNDTETEAQALQLMSANGEAISARAHLQIVPWLGSKAMMFAFEPQVEDPDEDIQTQRHDDDSMLAVSDSLKSAAFDEVAELRAILDTATDGVVVIDPEGTIRSINGSASALFGYQSDEIVEKSFSILFAHESQRAAMDYLDGFTNNGVASLLNEGRELLARERNGGFLPVFMTIGKLPTSNGYCAVMRDITPWKQTEQALQAAKDEAEDASSIKSDFLAKISHEIRTPLNAIIGFSELMAEERFGAIGNDRYKEYLNDINKSGRHVLDLVNDLLDISKIEAGEQELDFEGVLLNEAVADAISMVQPQANRNRIIVRSSLEANLPLVVADARSIKQIVLNLLSNSIRFTPSGGQVVVTTNYSDKGTVVLRIRDTGVGMSAREIETALRPFKQVTTGDSSDGTGLGLPLTKALVEANRAEFDIASEPGRGTSVEVTFPSARVLAD